MLFFRFLCRSKNNTPAVSSGPGEQSAHVPFVPGFYSVRSIGPHLSSARPEIRNGEFVDMRELLADNILLYNQLEDFRGHTSGLAPHTGGSLAFIVGVLLCSLHGGPYTGPSDPQDVGLRRVIIREALRHGAMAGLSMVEPFGVRQRWIHLCLGIRLFLVCRQLPFYALAHLGGSVARCAASPITQPVSMPFQLSSLQRTLREAIV